MKQERIVAARMPARPRSAVSGWTGLAGLCGLLGWAGFAFHFGMDGPYASLVGLAACALPIILVSLLVERVHRRPSTGIDWDAPLRPFAQSRGITAVKLVGLWTTWAAIGFVYCVGRWYWDGAWLFAMRCFEAAAIPLAVVSVLYIGWIDRRLIEPRDDLHAFGSFVLGLGTPEPHLVHDHLRAWGVKGFFLAFMLSIVPGNWANVIAADPRGLLGDPVQLSNWAIDAMFMLDVSFATVGYLLTLRPLDAHIRQANPFAAAWMAALVCYPPFILMNEGGPLDYHQGVADWSDWFAGYPVLLVGIGVALVALTAVYAWATIAFGPRFSNLTNRGIITNGPYTWTKHPAYLSKNLFWWLSSVPVLATTGLWTDAVRNTAVLATVSGVYYWRARTEERHLGLDPDYQAYAAWANAHAPVPRFLRRVSGR